MIISYFLEKKKVDKIEMHNSFSSSYQNNEFVNVSCSIDNISQEDIPKTNKNKVNIIENKRKTNKILEELKTKGKFLVYFKILT